MIYVICSGPRTGSSMLCAGLAGMGIGKPFEAFNPRIFDFADVERSLAALEPADGVLGMKVHYHQLAAIPGLVASFGQRFPDARYVSLTRRSIIRQAVSFVRAQQTQQWSAHDPAQGEPRFDNEHIKNAAMFLAADNERWECFYRANKIEPLRVCYEELAEDYINTVRRVALYLGEVRIAHAPACKTRQQADLASESWVNRVLEINQ